jgi:hypothetical protein
MIYLCACSGSLHMTSRRSSAPIFLRATRRFAILATTSACARTFPSPPLLSFSSPSGTTPYDTIPPHLLALLQHPRPIIPGAFEAKLQPSSMCTSHRLSATNALANSLNAALPSETHCIPPIASSVGLIISILHSALDVVTSFSGKPRVRQNYRQKNHHGSQSYSGQDFSSMAVSRAEVRSSRSYYFMGLPLLS